MKLDAIYFENGIQTTKTIDLATSQQFTRQAKDGKCYQNSLLAMLSIGNETNYVEGYAIFYNDKIFNLWHHGWLEKDDEIIDTYPGLGVRYGIMYFVGKRYSYDEAINKRILPSWHIQPLVFAIKTYHRAIRPGNPFWFLTAGKLALAYAISRKE